MLKKSTVMPYIVTTVARKLKVIPAEDSKRVMKFPYTTAAQIALFPYRLYWDNQWLFRYCMYACGLCFPIFTCIDKLVQSPENKERCAEMRAKNEAQQKHALEQKFAGKNKPAEEQKCGAALEFQISGGFFFTVESFHLIFTASREIEKKRREKKT